MSNGMSIERGPISSDGLARPIAPGPSASTAFGEMRVSLPGNRFDAEFLYNLQPDLVDTITNGGSASVTHNANSRDVTLSVGTTTDGEHATLRSHPIPYTPGNGQLIEITGVPDLAAIGGGAMFSFIRTSVSGSVVETTYPQTSWDNKKTGQDWTDSHIFAMKFQSLKVGSFWFELVCDGARVQVGQIDNDNTRNTGYWQLASLQAYWRIHNDATYTYMEIGYGDEANAIGFRYRIAANASATMKAICGTVKSEGGAALQDMPGLSRTTNNGTTARTVSTTLLPLLSIRSRDTFNSLPNLSIALPKSFSIQTDDPILLKIIEGGTLGGTPSWNDVDTNGSSMEYDVAASSISGGRELHSAYLYASSTGPASSRFQNSDQSLLSKTVLWDRQDDSETGILSICAIRTSANDASVLAALDWDEIR